MTDESSNTQGNFEQMSRSVVEGFLQSVVIVDDLAHLHLDSDEPVGPLKVPGYQVSSATKEPEVSVNPPGVPLDAKTVIDKFAEIGSVCGVICPRKDETKLQVRVVKAAKRADIVVLDWKIDDSNGDSTLGIMRQILEEERPVERLRLIAIYTGEPGLQEIAESVKKILDDIYGGGGPPMASSFCLEKGPLRIVILAKKGGLIDGVPDFQDQVVGEGQLADRLVDEFTEMTSGLLCNVGLAGISAIREKAHRVLAKFNKNLDAAYLGHRVLLPHPPDAEDHIVEALGSELLSVLEEDRVGEYSDINSIHAWLFAAGNEGLGLFNPQRVPELSDCQCCIELLKNVMNGREETNLSKKCQSRLGKYSTNVFAADADTAKFANRRLAVLLSLKSRYTIDCPRLTSGTILSAEDGKCSEYFLCVQPKCDSVRLSTDSGFPLLPLKKAGSSGKDSRLVLELESGNWVQLKFNAKPSELIIQAFKPRKCPPKDVVAKKCQGGFYFEDIQGRKYRWIAELKNEHALRVAGEIAGSLARTGPNDSEWLRRLNP